jgi:hypothetical protein
MASLKFKQSGRSVGLPLSGIEAWRFGGNGASDRKFVAKSEVVGQKLTKLLKATVAVEKLIFEENAHSTWRVFIQPDWTALKAPLLKLSITYGLDCSELAKILTAEGNWGLRKKSTGDAKINDAGAWLVGVGANTPIFLRNYEGLLAIKKAAESGDVNFFIRLGEHLRYGQKVGHGKKPSGELTDSVRWVMETFWKPWPAMRWPGLAYCKPKAQWGFFQIGCPSLSKKGNNYLSNLAADLGLVPSKHRFISEIKLVDNDLLQFS